MRFFDLSLRHKIPLWGGGLIVASALAVSAALMFRAYDDLKQDLLISSQGLGHTLAKTLFKTLLHDDFWRAFEIIDAPFGGAQPENPLQAETIFVVNPELKVLVSTDPKSMPVLADLSTLGADHQRLAESFRASPLTETRAFDLSDSHHLYVATPVAEEGVQLGILVIAHSKDVFLPRFMGIAGRGAAVGALVLAVLLPINWYWGRRMVEPLVELANGMGELVRGAPSDLRPDLYAYRDELGRLFEAYRKAAAALREKALLEHEVLRSERLAAVGRLAAGIAHEVNNPLGGMLMTIENLRDSHKLDPPVATTISVLERGLRQIAETVGALLVQARTQARPLTRHDFEDVRTLVEPQAVTKYLVLSWAVNLPEQLPVPANFVRQIVINLLLNAVQATAAGRQVSVYATVEAGYLLLRVSNETEELPPEVMTHLFEPFVSGREGGHGLGLWVTWQTVKQLDGRIGADWSDGEMRVTVTLPLADAT